MRCTRTLLIVAPVSCALCGYEKWVGEAMKLKVIVHEAEEGGYWARVPSIPGRATFEGETFDELLGDLYEAAEDCLSEDVRDV